MYIEILTSIQIHTNKGGERDSALFGSLEGIQLERPVDSLHLFSQGLAAICQFDGQTCVGCQPTYKNILLNTEEMLARSRKTERQD